MLRKEIAERNGIMQKFVMTTKGNLSI